jgi:hypothetical protein
MGRDGASEVDDSWGIGRSRSHDRGQNRREKADAFRAFPAAVTHARAANGDRTDTGHAGSSMKAHTNSLE